MPVNAENARIFGSDDDKVYVGPVGSTLPTTLAAPAATLVDAGWLHTDGFTIGQDATVNKFRGHQGGRVVRTKVSESGRTVQFQCLETTALTLGLQLNIKTRTTATQVTTMTVSTSTKIEARALVIDTFDIDGRATPVQYRYVIPRAEIGERSEFKLAGTDITAYNFTAEIIGDFFIITNDPVMVVV